MKAITKTLRPFEVKEIDAEARTFEGLAATWDLDLGGDVIHRGAFQKTLAYWQKNGFAIPLIDQHRYTSIHDVLGSMVDAKETDDGLWARFEVDDDEPGRKLIRHIENRRINGLSIGYEAVNPERDENGVRHLKEIKLFEVSAVLWPMNPAAQIDATSVKGLLADPSALSDEDLSTLRDALDAEAKARADATLLSETEMGELRALLLDIRLRPLLSRTTGQANAGTP